MQRIAEHVQKLVNAAKIFKEDSAQDNILSGKAAKKIHETGNFELHEVQQRTDKVQCQRCYSYMEAGFQVCPCGGKLNMPEEMLYWIRQKISNSSNTPARHSKVCPEPRHGAQPWQKHHFFAKECMRKINKKGIHSSIHDRFQNDEVFHASQLQHNWTKEWCEYLDYVRTIDTTHNASTEQLERYAALYHFRYHPEFLEKGPYEKSSRPSRNCAGHCQHEQEAGQNPQITSRRNKCRDDLDSEKLEWLIWLSHNWKWYFEVNRHSGFNSTRRHHRESEKRASLGKPRSIDSNIWQLVESKLVEQVLVGKFKMDMEWRSLDFFFLYSGFRTRCGHYSVCDGGCKHSVSHAHFLCTFSLRDVQTSRARMAQGVCSVYVISLHLTFSILMIHPPSLLFPHGDFDTTYPSVPSSSRVKHTSARDKFAALFKVSTSRTCHRSKMTLIAPIFFWGMNWSLSFIQKPSTGFVLQKKLFVIERSTESCECLTSNCLQNHDQTCSTHAVFNHTRITCRSCIKMQFQRSGHQPQKKASSRPVVLPSPLSSASAWFSCISRSTWGSRA